MNGLSEFVQTTRVPPRFGLGALDQEQSRSEQSLWANRNQRRRRADKLFYAVTSTCVVLAIGVLVFLLASVFFQGSSHLTIDFLTSFPSRFAARAGIKSAIFGTAWLMFLTAVIAIPIGIGAAVYLEEFSRPGRLRKIIEINISNLAGVPSIVYGLLGLALFVRYLHLGQTVLSGALTLSLMVLPVIITAAREALRAVPDTVRLAAFAMGATRWQAVRAHVLPASVPGIATGVILSLSRAIGETAPLLLVGAASFIAFVPSGPLDDFTALPMQIFNWASRPQAEFHELAAAAIVVLLIILLAMNATAIFVRNHFQGKIRW